MLRTVSFAAAAIALRLAAFAAVWASGGRQNFALKDKRQPHALRDCRARWSCWTSACDLHTCAHEDDLTQCTPRSEQALPSTRQLGVDPCG